MLPVAHLPSQPILPAEELPLTMISLEQWGLVTVSGAESRSFLQGQVTCDLANLIPGKYLLGANCDHQGKVVSCFHLFELDHTLALLQRQSLCQAQLAMLRKHAIFSQAKMALDEHFVILGIAGANVREVLNERFSLPSEDGVVALGSAGGAILHFQHPRERFLFIATPQQAAMVADLLESHGCRYNSSDQWLALDIAAGMPLLDESSSGQWLPQAFNLDKLQGISFTKGCYLGQESIARTQYRGGNRRTLYWLSGSAARSPTGGEQLELQLGENWRATGSVLAAVRLVDGMLWIQALLPNNLAPSSRLRVAGDTSSLLQINPLNETRKITHPTHTGTSEASD